MVYELWRQDDNGNRFAMGRWPDRASAEARLAQLSRGHHKQTYWITAVPEVPKEPEPDAR